MAGVQASNDGFFLSWFCCWINLFFFVCFQTPDISRMQSRECTVMCLKSSAVSAPSGLTHLDFSKWALSCKLFVCDDQSDASFYKRVCTENETQECSATSSWTNCHFSTEPTQTCHLLFLNNIPEETLGLFIYSSPWTEVQVPAIRQGLTSEMPPKPAVWCLLQYAGRNTEFILSPRQGNNVLCMFEWR